jgi:hypothetical protein
MDLSTPPALARLSAPVLFSLVAIAACSRAPVEDLAEWNGEPAARSVVGMWGGDDGWSIATGGRLGEVEARSRNGKAEVAEVDVSLAGTHG